MIPEKPMPVVQALRGQELCRTRKQPVLEKKVRDPTEMILFTCIKVILDGDVSRIHHNRSKLHQCGGVEIPKLVILCKSDRRSLSLYTSHHCRFRRINDIKDQRGEPIVL